MSKYLVLFFALALAISGCSVENPVEQEVAKNNADIQNYLKQRNLTYQRTADGMYYSITSTATTSTPSVADLVTLHYKLSLLDGTFVDSTSKVASQSKSIVFGVSQSLFTLPVSFMKAGDKGTFLLPSSLAFGANTFGNVPAYAVIKAEVEVVSIQSPADQITSMQTLYGFSAPEKTTSGLVFQKTLENPAGASILTGQLVKVNYTGRLGYGYIQTDATNKVVYDSKFGSGTLTFTAGAGQLIAGFEEAALKLKVGEKGKAILPYTIAYGASGNSTIPGYSPLYFEIEVVSAQ
ncbi:FKBP-type peptidyl-prolyl cis-trans isomerase [Aquirufa antheringensis]